MSRYAQWLQAGSYAASVDRFLIGALWPNGASTGCACTGTATMAVNVAVGAVAVPTQNSTGSTLCTSTAVEQVTLAAAPGSGNRIDIITCHPRGNDLDGGSNNDFIFDVVTGNAATTPVAPAVPAGQLGLYQVYVPQGVANTTSCTFTDIRPAGLSIGAPGLPPPVTSGSTVQSFTDSTGVVWVAKNGVYGGAWRQADSALHGRWYRAAAFTVAASALVALDTVNRDPYGMLAGGKAVAPIAGIYGVRAVCGMTGTVAGQLMAAMLYQNGAVRANVNHYCSAAGSQYWDIPVSDTFYCAAGDTIELWARSTTSAGGGASTSEVFMAVDWLGAG